MIKACDCPCHEPGARILHFNPCCSTCPKCSQGFKLGLHEHIESCTVVPPRLMKRKWKPGDGNLPKKD